MARLNIDGSLDNGFSGDGKQTIDFASGVDYARNVALQPDGKIILTGYGNEGTTDYDFAVARLRTDGAIDNTFSGDGKQTVDFGLNFDFAGNGAVQPNGKIVIVGFSNQAISFEDFAVARLQGDDTLTATFSGNDLVISDIAASGINNLVSVSRSGSNLVITDTNGQFATAPAGGTLSNGNKTLTIPLSSIIGSANFQYRRRQ